MSNRPNIVLLGVCSGSRKLIRRWANTGVMPTFQRLFAEGLTGYTGGLPGFFVGGTWPSIYTAVSPARHSRHYPAQIIPGTYDLDHVPAGERVKRRPFWSVLSEAGRRVAVLDFPHSSPTRDLNGIHLVGWDLHDADYERPLSWPAGLAKDVVSRFGLNPAGASCDGWRDTKGFVEFRESLLSGVERKLALTRHFLKQDDWDLFAQVFTEGHCAGHQCWHFHDADHPAHDPRAARIVGDPIRDVYVAIDAALGTILNELDQDTVAIVLMSHGMGPKYSAQVFLERILIELGLANQLPAKEREIDPSHLGTLDPLVTNLYRKMPQGIRRFLQPARDVVRRVIDREIHPRRSTLDFAASRCFGLYNNAMHSGVRVNLIGREPEGTVSPGAEFKALLKALEADLRDIINLDTGQPVVRRIVHTAEAYRGEYLDCLPDLSIEWNTQAPIFRIGSPKIGELHDENRSSRTGDHVPGGMFIAVGPSIKPGRLSGSFTVMDIAPTITKMLGVEMSGTDGYPIQELCGRSAVS